MSTPARQNAVTLGDLVAAAFDCAGTVTTDPRVTADLTARTVARRLARTHRSDLARQLRRLDRGRPRAAARAVILARAA
jgi:hypothetical protein